MLFSTLKPTSSAGPAVTSAPGPAGYPGRQLRADAADQRWRGQSQGFKAAAPTFETAIIERYRRRESSVEESLIEMYLAGISVRRVEDNTEALWARG